MNPSASQIDAPSASERRSEVHWDKEIAHLRTARLTMPPAAIECVRTVLEAILKEVDLEPTIAGSARQLLEEITQQATRPDHDSIRPTRTSQRRRARRQLRLLLRTSGAQTQP
jgi:hypothetical protein